MSGPAKIFVSLPTEIKHILTVLVTAAACITLYQVVFMPLPDAFVSTCIWSCMGFLSIFMILKYVFGYFAGERASVLAVSLPALVLAFFLRDSEAEVISEGMLILLVYCVWLIIELLSKMRYPSPVVCFIADIVMVYGYFYGRIEGFGETLGKIIYASLLVLTVFHIRMFTGGGRKYPFVYFLVLLIFIVLIPVREEPIDWDPVIEAGKRVADKTKDMVWSASYYLEDLGFGSPYYTGYSSLAQNGNAIHSADKTEIELKTRDNTTFRYVDEDSGKKLKRRRVVYLTGGREADHEQLLDIVFSLYVHGVDREEASLFARNADLDVTYVYLKTRDEIIPVGAVYLTDSEGNTVTQGSGKKHKKGYRLRASYLDLDYGSPYLAGIIVSPIHAIKKEAVSSRKLYLYASDVLGIKLDGLIGEDEYAAWQKKRPGHEEYLDVTGSTEEMRELAQKITEGCSNDLEKCRSAEAYLRQYKYRTDTGYTGGDTGSTEGMSAIADGFLFETGSGYCVHFASSMVMLLRLNGIPARLASGYRYAFPFERQETYAVSSSNAHVWPEAYVDGFGWVGFEPTPAMSTAQERTWHRHSKSAAVPGEAPEQVYVSNVPVPVHTEINDDIAVNESETGNDGVRNILKIGLVIVAAVVFMVLLMILGSRLFKALRYKMADPNRRLMLDIADITGIIRTASGLSFEDRGILSDYEPYIPDKFKAEARHAFEICDRIRYRSRYVSENEEKVTKEEEIMVRELKNMISDENKRHKRRKNKKKM